MKKMMAAASCAALLLAVPAQAGIQDAPKAEQSAPATGDPAVPECKPKKKKKGLGLGGLLRAARNSGLVGSVAGKIGGDSYLASAAASTAIDVAASQPAKPDEPAGTSQC